MNDVENTSPNMEDPAIKRWSDVPPYWNYVVNADDYIKLKRELATVTKERDEHKIKREKNYETARKLLKIACKRAQERDSLRSEVTRLTQELACKLNEPLVLRAEVERLYALLDKLGYERLQKVFVDPATAQSEPSQAADTLIGGFVVRGAEPEEPSQVGGKETCKHQLQRRFCMQCDQDDLTAAQATIAELLSAVSDVSEGASNPPTDIIRIIGRQHNQLRTENAALCEQRNRPAVEVGAIRAENAALRARVATPPQNDLPTV